MDAKMMSVLPVAELLIIKRDFDLAKKISTHISPSIAVQFTPYLALFCYEALGYLKQHGQDIDLTQTSQYSIKDIRQKAKFFDFSLNKLLQCVENVDAIQNEYFIQSMNYPECGHWNIHENLGIYYDMDKNIVSNTQYEYYVFQNDRDISRTKDIMHGHAILDNEVFAFGNDMGRIIEAISSGLSSISDFVRADFDPRMIPLYAQNYNTNRCLPIGNEKYKIIRLFLLHVLSSIGLLLFYLKKSIVRDTGLLLRLEYITYHYALRRMDCLSNYCNRNENICDDRKLLDMLNSIDFKNKDGLRKTEFRNCVMHFGLTNADGEPLIKEEKLNLAIPFCGLIESQFQMTYEEYKDRLESQLMRLYQKIKLYLSIDMEID